MRFWNLSHMPKSISADVSGGGRSLHFGLHLHLLCICQQQRLSQVCVYCQDLISETTLLDNVISTKFSCAGCITVFPELK